jgi:hypothetical protein
MANQMLSSVERVPTEITYLAVQRLPQSGILSLRAIIIHCLCHHGAREQGRLWSEWEVASGRNGNEPEVLFRPVSTSAILGLAPWCARCAPSMGLSRTLPHHEPGRACNSSSMAADSSKWPGEWHPARNDVALASEAPDPAHLADFKTRLLASAHGRGIPNLMHIDLMNAGVSLCQLSGSPSIATDSTEIR